VHGRYENQKQSLHQSRTKGTLFQIHLWYYPGDCALEAGSEATAGLDPGGAKEVLRLEESLHTNWDSYKQRIRTGEWLHAKVRKMRPGSADNTDPKDWLHGAAQGDEGGDQGPEMSFADFKVYALEHLAGQGKARDDEFFTAMFTSLDADGNGSLSPAELGDDAGDTKPAAAAAAAAAAANPTNVPTPTTTMEWHDLPKESKDWPASQVDINLLNNLDVPVTLYTACKVKKGEHSSEAFEVGVIEPRTGHRFVSHEWDRWMVKDAKGDVIKSWDIDIAQGIVQDLVVT